MPVIVNQESDDPKRILGYNHFPRLYSNIALISKKASGKTSVIHEILKNCANSRTKVIFFCSTLNVDPTYAAIFKMLDSKKIEYEKFTSLKDDDGKTDLMAEIIDQLTADAEPESEDDDGATNGNLPFVMIKRPEPPAEAEEKKKNKRKPKKLSPELIFCLDDMGAELRSKSITQLLKKHRHFHTKVILSSQTLTDLDVGARNQLDYFLCFKSLNDAQLEKIYGNMNLAVDYERFKQLYDYATADKFNFLYVDIRQDQFRKNFNELLE